MKTIDLTSELNILPVDSYKEKLAPEYIYIPMNDESTLYINVPSNILKDDLIITTNNINYFASISGEALDYVTLNNQKFIRIKNNYLENSSYNGHSRNLNKISKDNFLETIHDNNLSEKLQKASDTLYINCIEDEPYFFNYYIYLKQNMDEVLNTCKAILNIFSYKKIVLLIKQNYQSLITKYIVTISEYGCIEMITVPNIYPIGNMDLLKSTIKHSESDEFISINDLIKIIYKVKKNKIDDLKYFTINGNCVKEPMVFIAKKYQLLTDLLSDIEITSDNYEIMLNNSLCGDLLTDNNIIIDDSTNGIIINKKTEKITLPCNNCGLCYSVCPLKNNPLEKNANCIKCGLCNFICPMKINIVKGYQEDERNNQNNDNK